MPVALKRAIDSPELSAYERFHCIFQAAVTGARGFSRGQGPPPRTSRIGPSTYRSSQKATMW